jgi:hypothetical protein
MPNCLHNPAGRGGPIASEARMMRESSLCKIAALLTNGRAIDDSARVAAAREILTGPRHLVTTAQRERAIIAVREMIESDATADEALVAAHRLVMEVAARGRRAGRSKAAKQ